ncbi:hypothetical protein DL89DRAFT_268306 [Linderina pennispora]|uniref:CoA-dependent acyltransferase n=1 Tax=Linderina pennispora TaxID=61395 RepID=A0A1Y1W5F1_9FUNG|nr:uncharacterized protein DL89DRAFT_268306 [Linderina pennispora]ORX68456.1 hypothetical protein DL89DRAFT_268306 [Linderina pennispora]
MEIVVDKGHLSMPGYHESLPLVHFSKMQSSRFNPATWPDNLVPVEPVPSPNKATGKIKLLHVHVVRLKDNSEISISINLSHSAADSITFMTFLNCWADEMCALVAGVSVAEVTYCFGADVIKQHLLSERAPLSDVVGLEHTVGGVGQEEKEIRNE